MSEDFQAYASFQRLGGLRVPLEDVISEVSRWPIDGLLGFLGLISLEALQTGSRFFDPRHQGGYLNAAIVDDFPRALPNAPQMYAPGRIPRTGGAHVLIHEHNIAWLSHMALLYAERGGITPDLSFELQRRTCRLLLIANDFFSEERSRTLQNLSERRAFALKWLRHYQFNKFFHDLREVMLKLARQWILMVEILPRFFDVESAFRAATGGITIQRYFEVLALFWSHVHSGLTPENRWMNKSTMCSNVQGGREEIEFFLHRWASTPVEYQEAVEVWETSHLAVGHLPHFDFVPLRETPLIEARSGELICPVIPFLLSKISDEPYFILSDHLENHEQFQSALGLAYQEYAHSLVSRLGSADIRGEWQVRPSPRTRQGVEISDSLLQRGNVVVAFEHKGQRQSTDFLRGGQGERVLGPNETILSRLDQGQEVSLQEGRTADSGLLTRGMWQQSIAGRYLPDWTEREMGTRPNRVFPIITYSSELQVDKVVRLAYLNRLLRRGSLYSEGLWQRPEWFHIEDLEWLVGLVENGDSDLQTILEKKSAELPDDSFRKFLGARFGPARILDSRLFNTGMELMRRAGGTFFDEEQFRV